MSRVLLCLLYFFKEIKGYTDPVSGGSGRDKIKSRKVKRYEGKYVGEKSKYIVYKELTGDIWFVIRFVVKI